MKAQQGNEWASSCPVYAAKSSWGYYKEIHNMIGLPNIITQKCITSLVYRREETSGKQSMLKQQYEGKSRPLDAVETSKREHLPTVRQATEVEGAGYFYRWIMNMFVICMPWLTPDCGDF